MTRVRTRTRFPGDGLYLRKSLRLAILLWMATGLAVVGGQAQTETAPRFEVTKYTITAELFPSTHLLSAKSRIDLVPKADLTTLSFELHSSLRVEKVVDASGQEVAFKQDGLSLSMSFLNPLPRASPLRSPSVTEERSLMRTAARWKT